ncbi:uncharacterized protein C8R40DRAFT_513790 [Lentinula edodes]|uniref:uncharacterized protein n=1 Tax=Lentinula edodes TaxID=5353 RepID=UPI001E8D8A56|nr:uncharacterized protein C8R40DRAFT_513790 [Lentinula edodes]KAH7871942.1 hypothetical protein C8R40DRAFT_513790 [Lentinula edodes]
MLGFSSPVPISPSIQQYPSLHDVESRWDEREGVADLQASVNGSPITFPPSNPLANHSSTIPLPPSEDERTPRSSSVVVPMRSPDTEINQVSFIPMTYIPTLEQPQPTDPLQSTNAVDNHERPSPHHAGPEERAGFRPSHDHDRISDSSSSPLSHSERPPYRVRWGSSLPSHSSSNALPGRWDTPLPHPPLHTSSSINPPPTTNPPSTIPPPPMYPFNMTPLWSSNGPPLRSLPNPPLYYSNQSTPWYYTPHPLPANPVTPYTLPPMTPNPIIAFTPRSTYGPETETAFSMNHTPSRMHQTPSGFDTPANATPSTHNSMYRPTPEAPRRRTQSLEPEETTYERYQPRDNNDRRGPPNNSASATPFYQRSVNDQPHNRFYLIDGNVEFRVTNILFRVHLHFFSQARVFFAFPYIPPIIDLTAYCFSPSEFSSLLTMFYPRTPGSLEIQTVEEWISVLNVTSALGMEDIRTLAMKRILKDASPVDRIMLASYYDIDSQILVAAFEELCMRSQPLTEAEGKKVGVEGLIKLARMKHELQHNVKRYLDPVKIDQMLRRLVESP